MDPHREGDRHEGDHQKAATGDIYKPEPGMAERKLVIGSFHVLERLLLGVVALLTLAGAAFEVAGVFENGTVTLADILLMFLYTEVVGMVAVFYSGQRSVFVYPIFIGITALARLIILQGKEMAPENILFEAGAILLLSLAALIVVRISRR
ncbi:phosphate-starvation-inducible protein PsiE [Pararhizobium mangrovi]|uniref:Protein PsiE n=1 Tax=Pararhizobium mangrovi TaxID=2590452 RepID=A0A506U402_9HYPH|nr:phosphate-starvation-inducible PsiE family protein [Pararhizobium mangrovi]TPW26607.1 phosphate-starvation-inducible E [Pararhizobium mangrovi]